MTTPPSWRDLAAQANPDPSQAPQGAVTWRDLREQGPATDAAGAAPPSPAPAAPPPPPVTAPAPAGPVAPPPGVSPGSAWDVAAQHGIGAAVPPAAQPSAPSVPVDPAEANAALGMQIAGAGGAADQVDTAQLLRYIQNLEARFEALQREQAQTQAPEVVKYATALADHLQAKADALPVVNADPDHTYYPALVKAAQLVNGAEHAAATGTGHQHLVTLAQDVKGWVTQHARRFPAVDYDYILQLAEEVAGAAIRTGLL